MLGNGFLPMFAVAGGGGLTGATWALDGSGRAYNVPTLGPELLTNPSFETFASGLATGWLRAVGSEVVAQETVVIRDGSSSQRVDTAGSSAGIYQYRNVVMLPGQWYTSSVWGNGSSLLRISINGNGVAQRMISGNGAWQQVVATFRFTSGNSGPYLYAFSSAALTFYADLALLREITLATTLATVAGSAANQTAAAKIHTLTTGTQAGVVSLLDSASNPQNFLIAYHDGTNVRLDKCVSGVYTNLITIAVAFTSLAQIEIRRPSGNTFQLWYGGSQRGTDQTVNDASIISNTIYGLFSTFSGNLFTEFTLGGAVIPFGF